ncbi:uncharacterized protein [Nicotiana sylvestris]|uniref:uncharacterized protein n=1 Tax=Nicotiana sylvestris TaxID=4096 RepID=UPI00388C6D24
MATPPNFEEGKSTYKPSRFNGQYYGWLKTWMHDFMIVEDSELWDIICDGPHVPMKKPEETGPLVPKGRREYSDTDSKVVEKNYRAKKILMCGIGPNENKLVKKILSVLPGSWESKVNSITKVKDLQTLTMDELIGNLKTYEMKRKKDSERTKSKKEKNLVLQAESSDSSDKDSDMAYLTKRFQKMVRRNGGIPKWGSSSKTKNNDLCHSLVNDKEILTVELGEAEQSRDDLVVCVVDLNETIANLEQEKEALNKRITSVENKRDDLMVVVVDLKETIEGLSNEKHTLEEKVASTEEERDDLLVICTNLEETIDGINREHRNVCLGKGKEVANESNIMLEKELTIVKTRLYSKLERNQQLQTELEKVRNDLEKSLKWTWSSNVVTAMYFKENCQARVQSAQKNKMFTDKVTTNKGPGNSERKHTVMDHGQ